MKQIHQCAECRLQLMPAGVPAVPPIGQAGDDENDQRGRFSKREVRTNPAFGRQEQRHDEKHRQANPRDGEAVGQVHSWRIVNPSRRKTSPLRW
jgi:hypothetical protein